MISNTTAIAEVFSRIDHKFDLMYSKRVLRVMSYRPVTCRDSSRMGESAVLSVLSARITPDDFDACDIEGAHCNWHECQAALCSLVWLSPVLSVAFVWSDMLSKIRMLQMIMTTQLTLMLELCSCCAALFGCQDQEIAERKVSIDYHAGLMACVVTEQLRGSRAHCPTIFGCIFQQEAAEQWDKMLEAPAVRCIS
jgi:hypothetical protein